MNTPDPAPLLTIDDLAARWQVTRERAFRRVRHSGLKSINLGTTKYPELRFRLETVLSWEARAEHVAELPAPQDEAPPPAKGPTVKIVGRKLAPIVGLGEYKGNRLRSKS